MKKVFGSKKKVEKKPEAPVPTLNETSGKVRMREKM